MHCLAEFFREDDGAVTVDWVVLCALAVALTVLATQMLSEGTTGLADNTASYMSNRID